jgi:iron(III) transport system ATP-binding protein
VAQNLTLSYGAFKAIDSLDFNIGEGKFVTLLGPSGCGKTTTLWLLAGLDTPTEGAIHFGNTPIVDVRAGIFVPPEKREFGLVFQSYAIWPHMTVRKNLEYPLKLRRVARYEINARVDEIAALVELESQLDKYPFQLSGGQQQRVALARTLIYRPHLLLLDEPLSNLDAKLRLRARSWLKNLHRSLGLTTIYVTHDQGEALAMSDEIIVLEHGKIVQRGEPEAVYLNPQSEFVASFIGNSNLIPGRVVRAVCEEAVIELDGGHALTVPQQGLEADAPVKVSVRQEAFSFDSGPGKDGIALPVRVTGVNYVGGVYEVEFLMGETPCIALARSRPSETDIIVYVRPEETSVFTAASWGNGHA